MDCVLYLLVSWHCTVIVINDNYWRLPPLLLCSLLIPLTLEMISIRLSVAIENRSQANEQNYQSDVIQTMPDFIPWGLGTSLCIMGYGTQHPHSQKELIIKLILGEIQPFKNLKNLLRNVWNAGQIVRHVRRSIHFLVKMWSF